MGRPAPTTATATADRFAELLGERWSGQPENDAAPDPLIRPLEQLVCSAEGITLKAVAAKIAIARYLADDVLDEKPDRAREQLAQAMLALDTALVTLARLTDVRGVAAERYSLELERSLKAAAAA